MLKLLKSNKKGFTLLEILLSIAIIGIIAGLSMPVYQSLQIRNDLEITANTIAQSLRRAQILSQSIDHDATWGVYIEKGNITIFKGDDYINRNSDFDEVFDVSKSNTPSGVLEIVYDKFTGEPQATGMITLTSITDETKNITINEKGTISF